MTTTLAARPHAAAPRAVVLRRWPGAARAARPLAALWWLHPVACVALVAGVYALFPLFEFTRVVPRAYIPGPHYAFGFALLAALAVGIAASAPARGVPAPRFAVDVPRGAMAALIVPTLVAYAVWFQPVFADPGLLLDIVAGRRSNLRDVAPTLPGITTMTQFGVAVVIAHAALAGGRARRLAWWERAGVALVFALGALRAFAWSERLALIELVLGWAVARVAFAATASGTLWRTATLLPLAAPPLLYLGFTATEAFRSWEFYKDEYDSVWAFALDRLLAYYATASNNGIGLLVENRDWPQYSGRYVAEWLYLMPGIGDELRAAVGDVREQYSAFLGRFARPEFNNPSGLFTIVFDIGYAGALAYFLGVGIVVGRLYALWRRGAPVGVLGYPVAALFLFELLRFNYLASSRFFPVALALVVLWTVARPVAPHAPRPRRHNR